MQINANYRSESCALGPLVAVSGIVSGMLIGANKAMPFAFLNIVQLE